MMRFLAFMLLLFAAVIISGFYGALHNQISFTVSSEYFTKFKYQQFGYENSAISDRAKVSLIGFQASWWMGIPIGVIVGSFGFLHRPAKLMIIRSLKSFGVVAVVALVVGVGGLTYGWLFTSHDPAVYQRRFIPSDLESPGNFLSAGYMHNFSYLGGLIGLVAGVVFQFIQRSKK